MSYPPSIRMTISDVDVFESSDDSILLEWKILFENWIVLIRVLSQ